MLKGVSSMNRRRIILPLALAFCFFLGEAAQADLKGKKIVLDPGHGTINYDRDLINSGKETRKGTPEFRLTLQIAKALGRLLQAEGAQVIFTRTEHDYWRRGFTPPEDNRARAFMANELKADAFIAIHCDWSPKSRDRGVTTLFKNEKSRPLAVALQAKMVNSLEARNRHAVQESFTVLDTAEMPAVIVECGFMSSRSESKKLVSSDYQQRVAKALRDGLKKYFSSK